MNERLLCYGMLFLLLTRYGRGTNYPNNLTSPKIIHWITPVIRGIMSLTVNPVKAHFNNVVSEKESQP